MVFVDTGGWIAMAVKRDRYHKKAATYYRKLSKDKVRLVTSNYVLAETYTRIRYDDGHAKALQFNVLTQEAIKAGRLNLEWVTPAIHKEAWDIFENYADQDFSFVDCTSFAIATRGGVKEAFGFDDHFKTMGLILKPAKTK
ncbi:MAG: PIN domain-containing protein [Deltaproteobacteria bacterium]|nr:PIN domain-containing protein [Deltaproteobacteria bacterium]